MRVRDKLGRHGGVPHPAVQKNDHRCGVRFGIVSRRKEEVGYEISPRRVEIDEGVGILEKFAIAGFAKGGRFNELFNHEGERIDRC